MGKVLLDFPSSCLEINFGYSIVVHGGVIAATTDCECIVQLNETNRTSNSLEIFQNIRYILFGLGAISLLVMNEQHLVYSTLFGGVAIYERGTGKGSGDRPTFDLFEQLDFLEIETFSSTLPVGN